MNVVILGATGQIGARLDAALRARGHATVPVSASSGVNTATGIGLAAAFAGAQVVVDVTNAPSLEADAAMDFFRSSAGHIVQAADAAGVAHLVVLSIVGTERLQDSGYFRAKLVQEQLAASGRTPWTVVRSTQFHEFLQAIALSCVVGDEIRVPDAKLQTIAADEVVAKLAEVVEGAPRNGMVEIAGPRAEPLQASARAVLTAQGDWRAVKADRTATYFGSPIDDGTLTPGPGARLGAVSVADWLRARAAG
ncbi:SDR family oxidoreductase [Pseudorhodoferax sp.]|uniref:SDR family oxidoreductase n=1 Tax=Pseudorhodoferax sp. TaxID=1993553 RepID=UPI002DD6829F|nr:NmrA family transcriptional regulator [Pseudorhodoferax sp.]